MKKILSLLTLLLICLNSFADNSPNDKAAILGKILDGKTGQPVEYATVAVYDQQTSGLISGTITSNDGSSKSMDSKAELIILKRVLSVMTKKLSVILYWKAKTKI